MGEQLDEVRKAFPDPWTVDVHDRSGETGDQVRIQMQLRVNVEILVNSPTTDIEHALRERQWATSKMLTLLALQLDPVGMSALEQVIKTYEYGLTDHGGAHMTTLLQQTMRMAKATVERVKNSELRRF